MNLVEFVTGPDVVGVLTEQGVGLSLRPRGLALVQQLQRVDQQR